MPLHLRRFLGSLLILLPCLLAGCATSGGGLPASNVSAAAAVASEAPGEYWIGRRYYKVDYKFWGYVRRPGQPWKTAKLVMLNEQGKLAPDREGGRFGSDNGYEYKLYGDFTGQTVYEPASNGFYPEFSLKRAELVSVAPPNIFSTPGALDPTRRIIAPPR